MGKGNTFTRLSAGLLIAVGTVACGGGDDAPEAGVADQPAPPAATPPVGAAPDTGVPGTAAPGGDPTTTPATTPGATAPAGGATAGGGNAALISQGQQAYSSSVCVSCHGPNAQGTPLAPALNDGEWLWVDPAEDVHTQVVTIIKTGVAQPKDPAHVAPMLPYGGVPMDDARVEAIAAYLLSLNQ